MRLVAYIEGLSRYMVFSNSNRVVVSDVESSETFSDTYY